MSLTKIGSIGINTGIQLAGVTTVATLHVGSGVTLSSDGDVFATGISTFSEDIKVGSGVTISPDGDVFFTGIATGNGSGLTALNATQLTSGTVPTARLGSGTASSSTFLRGDSSFQTINTDLVGDTSPQLGGDLASNGNDITMADTDKVILGTGSDLLIYHQSTQNFIRGSATASPLYIDCCENLNIRHLDTDGSNAENMIRAIGDGAVELYHDNSKKLETTSSGVSVVGNVVATGNMQVNDNNFIYVGNGGDLSFKHDTSNSFITNSATGGYLHIRSGSGINLQDNTGDENFIKCIDNGAVELYHNNIKKLQTSTTDGVIIGNTTDDANYTNTLTLTRRGYENSGYGVRIQAKGGSAASQNGLRFKISDGSGSNYTSRFSFTNDGLLFNSDTATANALDDYEEGTWTPFVGTQSGTNYTLGTTYNCYTKIGNIVHAHFKYQFTAEGDGTITIFNLPFAADSNVDLVGQGYVTSGSNRLSLQYTKYTATLLLARVDDGVNYQNYWTSRGSWAPTNTFVMHITYKAA